MHTRFRQSMMVSLFVIAAVVSRANAAYPEKPIEIVVPWPPGTSTDAAARAVAQAMSKRLGVPMPVVNKPGAQGVVGTAELARGRADGYTVGVTNIGPVVAQVIGGNAPYKSADLEPVGLFMAAPFLIVARGDAPFRTYKELADHAKNKEVRFGNFGPGAVPTNSVIALARKHGWQYRSVTFPNLGLPQLQSGDAEIITVEYSAIASALKGGQARAIAQIQPSRHSALPDVPTVRELGLDVDVSLWGGLFVPRGTPVDIVQRLGQALREALADPAVREFSSKSGIAMDYVDARRSAQQIRDDESWLRPTMEALGLIKKQ